jgi:hypothetical protein
MLQLPNSFFLTILGQPSIDDGELAKLNSLCDPRSHSQRALNGGQNLWNWLGHLCLQTMPGLTDLQTTDLADLRGQAQAPTNVQSIFSVHRPLDGAFPRLGTSSSIESIQQLTLLPRADSWVLTSMIHWLVEISLLMILDCEAVSVEAYDQHMDQAGPCPTCPQHSHNTGGGGCFYQASHQSEISTTPMSCFFTNQWSGRSIGQKMH